MVLNESTSPLLSEVARQLNFSNCLWQRLFAQLLKRAPGGTSDQSNDTRIEVAKTAVVRAICMY